MKSLAYVALLGVASLLFMGQYVSVARNKGASGPPTCGLTTQTGTDSGNTQTAFATPCVTGSDSNGYTVSTINYWVGSPVSTSFSLGVYSTTTGAPHTLLCSVGTGTITPSSGWNSKAITGCGTLTANTTYWVGYLVNDNTTEQGTVSGNCPGTSSQTRLDNGGESALPNPITANNTFGVCYSFYMTLTAL